ncbi:cupin [Paraburkholderia monticola]|uniref:cupin n=1 Tax=Paraburkholderia monticola TaxID=1399968 RepID=UPI00128FEE23|nr:cupin [Paraburkholderia monticola]
MPHKIAPGKDIDGRKAKALIVEGEIRIRVGDEERLYRAGDVFHPPANEAHAEQYGPQDVTYLVGGKG